jgi:hypothetical protein
VTQREGTNGIIMMVVVMMAVVMIVITIRSADMAMPGMPIVMMV